jgi:hypothetical protein
MPPVRTSDTRHAAKSLEQQKASQKRRDALLGDISACRGALVDKINEVSEQHDQFVFHGDLYYSLYDLFLTCTVGIHTMSQHNCMPAQRR